MNRTAHLMLLFAVALVIAILHHSAFVYYWYWVYWWFDIVVHFLGGFFIGLSFIWMYRYPFASFSHRYSREWLLTLGVVCIVAGLWEIFEMVGGISIATDTGFAFDTIIDICVGLFGGFLALQVAKSRAF